MIDSLIRRPIRELILYAYERFENLLKGEVSYDTEEDFAGILGLLLVLSRDKTRFTFYRYKETEGDNFEKFARERHLGDTIGLLKSIKAIDENDLLDFEKRALGLEDTKILDAEIGRLVAQIRLDPFKSGLAIADKYLVVHRRWGLSHVVEKRYIKARGPYYGYRVVERDIAISMLKKAFESRLERLFHRFKTLRIELPPEGKELLEKINERIGRRKTIEISLEGSNLYQRFDLRPPCIQIIYNRLENTGYLPHAERYQLGTFLKKAGMSYEEQLKFRYQKAADNANITREDFIRKGGYQIAHIYGYVGGKKDYNVPSCRRCRLDKYYCPFAKEDPDSLKELLKSLEVPEEYINKIVEEASKRTEAGYMRACMLYFEAKIGKRPYKARRNPLGYLMRAARAKGLLKKSEKKEDGRSESSRGRIW